MAHFSRMTMWRKRAWPIIIVAAFLCLSPAVFAQTSPDDPGIETLQAGKTVTYRQTLPVNVVFVGYDRDDINLQELRTRLPASYKPVVRSTQWYGIEGREMGLHFNLDYAFKFANEAFEDDFFGYLGSIAEPGDPTLFQEFYNGQANNILDVTGPVWYIDAPSAEAWLMAAGQSRLGIDPGKSYTVYFINWYERPDFQFHVYTKTDSPDPDTGYNFGELRASRKMVAWGGTHGRQWFYDLSAGPDASTGSYDVDTADLDGDGYDDYRIPPIWEYATGGYRDPRELSADLGRVTRFVAVNLLFTTSPLYDPLVTAPGPGGQRINHVEIMEMHNKSSGLDWMDGEYLHTEMVKFQPYYQWETVVEKSRRPLPLGTRRAVRIFGGLSLRPDCWEEYGVPFAQMYCFFDGNYDKFVPAYDADDYVAVAFGFNESVAKMGGVPLGFADDNWRDGTQSYVFMFDGPEIRTAGYGFTTTAIHELGHHYGMSHPHDGWDSEYGWDYGPSGDVFFAWAGDESHTMMSYIDVNWEFGQFDKDNMYRWEFAGYLNWANQILAGIQSHPDRGQVSDRVDSANEYSQTATRAFRQWDYLTAATNARMAYETIAAAADALGLQLSGAALASELPPTGAMPRVIDPIR